MVTRRIEALPYRAGLRPTVTTGPSMNGLAIVSLVLLVALAAVSTLAAQRHVPSPWDRQAIADVGDDTTGEQPDTWEDEAREQDEDLDRSASFDISRIDPLDERRLSHDEFVEHAETMLGALPSLHDLVTLTPPSPFNDDIPGQLAHIRALDESIEVSVEGFDAFSIDTSRRGAFADAANYHESIDPKMIIIHWTGMGYRDVDHFISSISPHRVQFFIDRQARAYDLFDDDRRWPAHALGVNEFAQGIEIESGDFDEVHSPVLAITADQVTQAIYVAVAFLQRNGLPVDHTTIVGHYAADLIFANPHYDPYEGTLRYGQVRKYDPPEELMTVIVRHAQSLDAALAAQGERIGA